MILFGKDLKVVNTGLSSFAENLKHSGVETVNVDWKPSVNMKPEYLNLIETNSDKITAANKKATDIILKGMPVLVGLDIAINVIPGMKKNLIIFSFVGCCLTTTRMNNCLIPLCVGGKGYIKSQKLYIIDA